MNQQNHPSKEQVRDYLKQRQSEHSPPPDIREIRRKLGWELIMGGKSSGQTLSDDTGRL